MLEGEEGVAMGEALESLEQLQDDVPVEAEVEEEVELVAKPLPRPLPPRVPHRDKEMVRADSAYRPEYAGQAEKLCLLLGATDDDLAAFFDVSQRAINRWKVRHPFFAQALQRGKLVADGHIAESLYRQAKGHYTVKRTKVFADPKTQTKMEIEYEEEQLPNVVAAMFWLKNRQPAKWRDRQKVEVGNLDAMTDEQLAEIAAGRDPGPV